MSTMSKIALVKEMIDSAELSLRSAKQLLAEVTGVSGEASLRAGYANAAGGLTAAVTATGKIIEGVFDGQKMIGPDQHEYPVPANYASKSKLIPGDVLKLTITDEGRFIYKQIGPAERKTVLGPLTYEDGHYKVIASGKAYKVLLASVTYYRAEPGDQISLIIPALEESEWGAIDNVIPRISAEIAAEAKFVQEAEDVGSLSLGELTDAEEAEPKPKRKKKEEKEE